MENFTTSTVHPYAIKKGITIPLLIDANLNIVCPIYKHGIDEEPMSYQRISPCGKIKKFDSGKKIKGGYWFIGDEEPPKSSVVMVAEGLATACAIKKLSGLITAISFGCQNLNSVGEDLVRFWNCQPILCPDVGSEFDTKFPLLPAPFGYRNFDWADFLERSRLCAPEDFITSRLFGFRGWAEASIPV